MFECKHTGTFDHPKRSARITLDTLEKLADEAWSESREPVLMLSIYAPDSVLADGHGFIDLTVRLMSDDVRREDRLGIR